MIIRNWEVKDFSDFQWRVEDPDTQADTFIEWCFEQKCIGITNGKNILNEWRNRKQEFESYIRTTIFDYQHYSRHDDTHSVNILNAIELVLGRERVKVLSASDLWLLLESAYFHDIGMTMTNDELKSLWRNEDFKLFLIKAMNGNDIDQKLAANYYRQIDSHLNSNNEKNYKHNDIKINFDDGWPVDFQRYMMILTSEYNRKRHANRAKEIMQKILDKKELLKETSAIDKRLSFLVSEISAMHDVEYEELNMSLRYKEKGFGTDFIHPRFAAAMLRLGDLLDMDNNRFSVRSIEHFGSLPNLSQTHYEKHKAITHFSICKEQISAEAFSDSEEVCQETSKWFQWIRQEVINLICDWNEIMPVKIQGCILRKSDLRVFLNGRPYNANIQKNYEVDKKRLVNLMTGFNIYDTELDCIREYIQNALDASKMKLWMNVKNKTVKRRKKQKELINITPFDLPIEAYEALEIEIETIIHDNMITFTITDHGVGMEEECLDGLAVIGQSWKNRELYLNEERKMPKWLRPTGGYGIGLQSAFMLTKCVKIKTKSAHESIGHELTLTSPRDGGNIAICDKKIYSGGTTISFDVPLKKFLRMIRQTEKIGLNIHAKLDVYFSETMNDCFEKGDLERYIIKYLKYYIATTFPNIIFPIKIHGQKKKSEYYRSIYATGKGFGSYNEKGDILVSEGDCDCFVSSDLTVKIWDKKENTYACFMSWPNSFLKRDESYQKHLMRLNAFCYRNARIKNLGEYYQDFDFNDFSVGCIDIMGKRMKDVVSIQRNSFKQNFDIVAYYKKYVTIYIKSIYHVIDKWEDDNIQKCLQLFLYIITAIQFVEKEIVLNILNRFKDSSVLVPSYIQVKRLKGKELIKDQMKVTEVLGRLHQIIGKERKNGKKIEEKSNHAIFIVSEEVVLSEIMIPLKNFVDENSTIPEETVNCIISNLKSDGVIYLNPEISRTLLHVGRRFRKDYFRITEESDENSMIYVMITGMDKDWNYYPQTTITKSDFLKNAFSGKRKRYIGENISCKEYNCLRIDELPGMQNIYSYSERKNKYLVSPISRQLYLKILRLIEIDESEVVRDKKITMERIISKDEFLQEVIQEQDYQFLISWVYEHQVDYDTEPFEQDMIDMQYRKMIEDIYSNNLQEVSAESEE